MSNRTVHQVKVVNRKLKENSQPAPKPNNHPAVWALVLKDMSARDTMGLQKYGTRLQPHNGRDVLQDAYEEALDLAVYLRQAIYERDNPAATKEHTP